VVKEEGVFDSTAGEQLDFKEDYFKKTRDEINRFFKEGKISDREIFFCRKDGKVVPVNQSVVMLENIKGKGSEIFSIMRDITDQKKVEMALIKAKQIADEANRSKSAFLANMSHEIRTPMNGVIGFTDMLVDLGLNPEQEDCARTIKQSGESLLSLVNDILDFSKIEAGKINIEDIDFDIEVLAYDVCEFIDTRIDESRVELLCRIDDNLPAKTKGDPHRFRQVLLNLMGNAVKFTKKGEIELSLKVEEEQGDRFKLHTAIRDTGIGISSEKLEAVFDLFQQADNSATRKYGGAGLGLSISKRLVELMGGHIWLESQEGDGTTVSLTIPCTLSAQGTR
jgi:two-component system sensor histidine kinase/response regulator